ncbi:angiopoietin-2-like [Osmerus eperlanus]|uniref:angiopoietin-2-like n=1 Tax=Osmerus eperlanus TaxID=29151 RepID=UPI002E13BF44
MGLPLALSLTYLVYLSAVVIGSERRPHRVQHGPCSYTFLLPEVDHCSPLKDFRVTNSLQKDSPPAPAPGPGQPEGGGGQPRPSWHQRKLEVLESTTENNTLWLQKLENYIQENVRSRMEEMKRNAAHTQTAAMLEMGTNLLSQSAEQTRKLTDVETQVLNQTSRLEIQLLENSLFTSRLENHILLQTQEISRLNHKNSLLGQRVSSLEARHQREQQDLMELVERQSWLVGQLQAGLGASSHNSSLLQRQQASLTDTVQQLLALVTHCNEISSPPIEEESSLRDCAELFRSGVTESGVYSLRLPNSTRTVKVFCDMKTRGGGWTVLQHRKDGSVDFHRGWKDYKTGFGDPSGEYWLGNDVIHHVTISQEYSLHVLLQDGEGNQAYSHYDHFYINGEDKNYSLHTQGFSGTAGKTSSLTHPGTPFSTKDRDNDCCSCKCAQMASGGWWFEACGPSNLNGIFYPGVSNMVRYNGIKWYYWKGPGLMATMTTMMVRPTDF